jgi:hypothetical protein
MSKKIFLTVALAALLLSSPALAQDDTEVPTETPPAETEEPVQTVDPVEETPPVENEETAEPVDTTTPPPPGSSSSSKVQTITISGLKSTVHTIIAVDSTSGSLIPGSSNSENNETQQDLLDPITSLIDQINTLLNIPDGEAIRAAVIEQLTALQQDLADALENLRDQLNVDELIALLPQDLQDQLADLQDRFEALIPDIANLPRLDEIFDDLFGGILGL